MRNLKNSLLRIKQGTGNKVKNIKNKTQNAAQNFQKNFSEAKNKPISKRRSLFLGFATVLSIFGVALFASVLPAVAKDIPDAVPKPADIPPAAAPKPVNPGRVPRPRHSEQIVKGLAGAAGTVCTLAASTGSFVVGAICGLIVVVAILKAQGD